MDINKMMAWQVVLQVYIYMYGVSGKLFKAVKSFYKENKAYMRVAREERKYFPLKVGLKIGMCHVSMLVEHFHGWCGEGGES